MRSIVRPLVVTTALVALAAGVAPASGQTVHSEPARRGSTVDVERPIHYPTASRRLGVEASIGAATPEALLRRFANFHSALRYTDARQAIDELCAMQPDHPVARFNQACVLARELRLDEALDALDRAVDCGWRNATHTLLDPDLERLRERSEFVAAIERMRELSRAEAIEPTALRTSWSELPLELGRLAPELMERYRVPGMQIAVVRDGRCTWHATFGHATSDGRVPLEDDGLFPVPSVAKLVTVIAAADLEESGRLDLTALLEDEGRAIASAPPVRIWRTGAGAGERVEAMQVPRVFAPTPVDVRRWPSRVASNETHDLLLGSIADATRRSHRHVRRDLLARAGARMDLGPSDPERGTVVRGHTDFGTPYPLMLEADVETRAFANVQDLAALIRAVCIDHSTVLDRRSIERLARLGAGELARLGIPLRADRTEDGLRMQVADVHEGVGCLVRWYPERGIGVAVLFNADSGTEAAMRIAHHVLGGA